MLALVERLPSAVVNRSSRSGREAVSRARRILTAQIAFVPVDPGTPQPSIVRDEPCTARLSRDQEVAMFLEMNRLKQRASQLRNELTSSAPDLRLMNSIEAMLDAATDLRNQLVEIFLGLAVSVSRQLVGPLVTMDELVSEASITLLSTVEKFDAGRGYRFSTYATTSMRHNLVRMVTRRSHERARRLSSKRLEGCISHEGEETWDFEREMRRLSFVEQQLGRLAPRLRQILLDRFGLNPEGESRTLRQVASQLGLSHERVRQLERRALEQIRENAVQDGIA